VPTHSNLGKTFLLLGIVISLIGIGVHIICPTELSSVHFYLGSEEKYVQLFKIDKRIDDIPYQLHLRVNLHSSSNTQVFLLNETEFLKFLSSDVNISDLIPITPMVNLNDLSEPFMKLEGSYQYLKGEAINLYLLIVNSDTESIQGNYYLGLTPLTYYLGIVVFIIGLLLIVPTLFYWFSDWKKYLTLGISANVFVFMVRIITVGKYNSIGMQFSFFGDLITPEMYNDFEFWYMSWIKPFLNGAFPYESLYVPELNEMFHYQMPPLFILTLGFFELLPLLPGWKIAIPIFICHLATGILVFMISCRNLGYSEDSSIRVMLFYYLNPISLIYASFCWFNPSIFVFFVLLVFYLITLEDSDLKILNVRVSSDDMALFLLAVGTMYKQFAAVFLPLVIITIIRRKNISDQIDSLKHVIRYSGVFFATMLIIILPFILTDFWNTVSAILISTTEFGIWWTKRIDFSSPVHFNSFFVILGLPDIFTDIIGFLTVYWILLGVSIVIIGLLFWYESVGTAFKQNFPKKNLFFWTLLLVICVHLFYPRGSFKFYLILLIPFLSLNLNIVHSFKHIDQPLSKNNEKRWINWAPVPLEYVGYFLFLMIIVLINRYIYFMLLVGFLVYVYRKKRKTGLMTNLASTG
jgi:hypothetical protein